MKQLKLTRIEHRKSTLMILIMLGVALIASPGTKGAVSSSFDAGLLDPLLVTSARHNKSVQTSRRGRRPCIDFESQSHLRCIALWEGQRLSKSC